MSWSSLFYGEAETASLLLFRTTFGLVVAAWMAARLRHAPLVYGVEGYGDPERVSGGVLLLSYLRGVDGAPRALIVVGALAGVCLALGVAAPVAAVVVFLCTVSLSAQTTFASTSWEYVIALLSLLLAIASVRSGAAWPIRLLQLQVCLIYATTFVRKLGRGRSAWLSGEPVYTLHHGPQGRFFVGWIRHPAAYRALAYYALAIEATFPVFVWWPPARYPVLFAIAGLHVGMELFLRIFPFQWVMLASLTLFVRPEDAERLLRGVGLA